MKQFTTTFKLLILFVAASLFFPSCDPDDPMDNVIAPTISLVDEAGFISSATTITAGETINVKVSANKGDAEMNSFTIKQDGTDLSANDFTIDVFPITNNPQLLVDGDRTSFTYEIAIEPHGSGTATYSFEVRATDQSVSTVDVDVTIDDVVVDPVLVNNMNPTITITVPESKVQIVLTATQGSSPLSTLSVFDGNNELISASRLEWEDSAIDANPYELLEADKPGFTDKKLFLTSSNIVGDQNYTITLTDEAGNTSTIPYTITLEASSTDFTQQFTGVRMFNNAGAMAGAIDLETGTNVSSGDASADLVDDGIDSNGNWQQTMTPVSGTTLKSIDAGTYTFDNVTSRELLIAAFNSGSEISQTGTLSVGTTYVAAMGSTYYILTVTSVNPTSGDNNDFFEFSINKSEL